MKDKKDFVYHIISENEWMSVKNEKQYYATSLENEGFIHFSFQQQVKDVATRFYAGQNDLLLLKISVSKLESPLKIDEVENDGKFPHLYGPLNLDSVIGTYPLIREINNSFSWQEG